MTSATSLQSIGVVSSEIRSNSKEQKDISSEKIVGILPFYNPTIYRSLTEQEVLNSDHKLVPSIALPSCTSKQTDASVDLIDAPFDLTDNNDGTVVLQDLSVRSVLKLLFESAVFKSSNILKQLRLAGGAVTRVIESDTSDFNRRKGTTILTALHFFRPSQ